MEQSMKTVTNVPGLKCYQCARLQRAEAPRITATGADSYFPPAPREAPLHRETK
jgi:hypothetical protein